MECVSLRKEPLGRADRGPGLATDRVGGTMSYRPWTTTVEERPFVTVGLDGRISRVGRPGGWESRPDWNGLLGTSSASQTCLV